MNIKDLRARYHILWALACKADGIDPESKFVVHSDDNPFTTELNRVAGLYQAAINPNKS